MGKSGSITREKTHKSHCQGGETLEQEPRGSDVPPSLEMLKIVLHMDLSNLIQLDPIWAAGWTR